MSVFRLLDVELEEWRQQDSRPVFFVRDDDVVDDTPALRRLLDLAEFAEVRIAFAVIPSQVTSRLVALFKSSRYCLAWQHGNRHVWHDAAAGISAGEFGVGRRLEDLVEAALSGKQAMDDAFGEGDWERVFVPPFHALDPEFKLLLPVLGYKALSAGNPLTPPIETVPEANAPIDLVNWKKREFAGASKIVGQIVDELRKRRMGELPRSEPLGILTHHRDFDENCWIFLGELLDYIKQSEACNLVSADELFADVEIPGTHSQSSESDSVALIITSCGRQDLLERTLESFFAFNDFPLSEIIVVEDGDGNVNDRLRSTFKNYDIKWISTGARVGQVRAIDYAYSICTSDYIFHCEDDWEFYRGGFIRESLVLLKRHRWLLQVWLRALGDTNKHPVLNHVFETDHVPFKLMAPNHDAGDWGQWHGFSWNPGLRRKADYLALGSFSSLDPAGTRETWRVEAEASSLYRQRGLLAAILATDGGAGYVGHTGKTRRVSRDFQAIADFEPMPKVHYSFVVDEDPVFAYEGWHLAHSLADNAQVPMQNIHVHFTAGVSVGIVELFKQLGCRVHELKRFGDGKFCNKLAQWDNLKDTEGSHYVFLDTDMVCIADFSRLLPPSAIGGKVVDLPNPPLPVLDAIFERAGFSDRPELTPVDGADADTYSGNCNGGLYSVPRWCAPRLFDAWKRHALWLLDDLSLLKSIKKEHHVDQIAFCLAVHEIKYPFEDIPSNANYYCHLAKEHRQLQADLPVMHLHYHGFLLNVMGLIQPPPDVTQLTIDAIQAGNRQISRHFNNRLFWDLRYSRFPERGSGVGSRGDNAAYKRSLLLNEGVEQAESVLDIGCGDLYVTRELNISSYTGADRSEKVLDIARAARPDWQFINLENDLPLPAEMVLCFEVLIHQPSLEDYLTVIGLCARSTTKTLIISGYDQMPAKVDQNHMIYFHEPLQTSLNDCGKFRSVTLIGGHTDVVIYRCEV